MLVKWFGSTTLENRWDRLVALANMEFMILKKEKMMQRKQIKRRKLGKKNGRKKKGNSKISFIRNMFNMRSMRT